MPQSVSVSTIAATAVANGHHMLKLEGYSWLKDMHGENGSYIESPTFRVGGHTWKIRCYLNGKSKEDAGFVSLFLHLCTYPDVHAKYEFALVPHQGTPPPDGHQGTLRTIWNGLPSSVRTFGNTGLGRPRFISVEELVRSGYLKDDCLAVRCTVTVVEERTVKEKAVQAHDMARLGMLCKCDDHLCKRHHDRPVVTFLERFANFCYSICRGPASK